MPPKKKASEEEEEPRAQLVEDDKAAEGTKTGVKVGNVKEN